MINKNNLADLLTNLGFTKANEVYEKSYTNSDAILKVDFKNQEIIYPEDKGLIVNERQTCNFSSNENFVVLECVNRLLEKGYKPEHMELEPKWKVGHGASGGRADILIKDNSGKSLLIIECKTAGKEHENAWKDTMRNGGQLFSYVQQARSTQFACLYSSDFIDNKVVYNNQIISLLDNEKLLEEKKDTHPLSYQDAQEVEDLFNAWAETYGKDYATNGIFEDEIPAYHIGKHKFSLNDLQTISSKDIQGKYHEFATILRQHNVSGRENAFDKLVNLFLCKIVDESRNPAELKFYWKGIAYDSNFDLQDRLQLLYQAGMKEFLGEDVTYIDNAAIDEAFRFFKNDPDATRDTIKKYFRELKFFTNNDFAFIDVHNEKLFYQNTTVLLKIVRMLQDIRLKTEEQNQFLGDMFEGFLDQGIKQSEGHFFTPMPIVKFILSSLPLENIIIDHEQPPKVIDYACGAGHFLNEYAMQIAPLVKKHKILPLTEYHAAIVGIEKEYRLSKVSKVSAFMYGQDAVQIIYNDALADNEKIKNNSYSLLVANPPYSVKGFLETLSVTDRNRFELIDSIDEKSFANNNSIETFFIERAKQLLKTDGVAGIIMPSSILSKGISKITAKKTNVYVAAREILLKYFDIVAIAEFGSGTFGKTGTNTVTLFLRRRRQDPAPADHYHNRIESWFNGDDGKNKIFTDEHFIQSYCTHLNYNFDGYKTMLQGKPSSNLLNTEMFTEYRKVFDNLADTKNRKKQMSFNALSKAGQQLEMDKKFLDFSQSIEKDKLYYFVLASLNPVETVIVRTPSGNAEMKKYLGYEWSSAKGNEGIKYLGGQSVVIEKDEEGEEALEEDDKRVQENLLNLNNIQTPLYDPYDLLNSDKINSVIRTNFKGEPVTVPEELQDYITTARLVDMLDFSRKEFNKAISLTPRKNVLIESKWGQVKLPEICTFMQRGKTADYGQSNIQIIKSGQARGYKEFDFTECHYVAQDFVSDKRNLQKVDLLLNSTGKGTAGRVTLFDLEGDFVVDSHITILRLDLAKALPLYCLNVFYMIGFKTIEEMATGQSGQIELSLDIIGNIKIPLPSINVQQKIVRECEAVDKEVEKARQEIEWAKEAIEKEISGTFNKKCPSKKIADFSIINPSKTEIRIIDDETVVSFVEMASVSDEGYIAHMEDKPIKELRKGSYTYFRDDDIILAKITPCMENGKCAVAKDLTNGIGMGSSEFHVVRVDKTIAMPEYVFAFLNRETVRKEAETKMTGSSGHRRVPASFYEQVTIPLPKDLKHQMDLVTKIQKHEDAITQAKQVIESSAARKRAILKKYL